MAHSRGRFPARGPKRSMVWSEGPTSTAVQSITAASKVIWSLGQTASGGITVVRIRGGFSCWLQVVGALGDGFTNVAVGIGIVSADAFAVGQSAMPGPITDPEWDWMYVNYFGAITGASTTEVFEGNAFRNLVVDTKAMRKIQSNQTIFAMVETEVLIGAATLTFSGRTRILSKLG